MGEITEKFIFQNLILYMQVLQLQIPLSSRKLFLLAVPCHFQTNMNAFVPKILGRKTQHTHIFPLEDLSFLCKGVINTTREYSEAVLHFA